MRGLCYLGDSINLMPTSFYENIKLFSPKPTTIIFNLVDRSFVRTEGLVEDVLVQLKSLIFPVDFVVLEFELDHEVSFILGIPFLDIGCATIYVISRKLTMWHMIKWKYSNYTKKYSYRLFIRCCQP